MKRIITILICIVLLIIDNTFAPFIGIKGAYPSFLFTFAVAYSLINNEREAVFIGGVSGILQDIFFSNTIGINALTNMLICLLVWYIGKNVFKRRKIVPVATMFLITILKHLSVFAIFSILHYKMGISIEQLLIVAIYNSIIMLIGYRYVFKFSKQKDNLRSKWRLR
ncbi:rod shape-determining protein MreD [uncultured Clostridium sp.]|uniref:rod shape-determining protein MreD n=1 Tax=uncultured Clostridium sp. TaxID=59620 RepID=UPI002587B0E3|nr:rod shape-determining protein MreD [uncultured Clostridium sp.]